MLSPPIHRVREGEPLPPPSSSYSILSEDSRPPSPSQAPQQRLRHRFSARARLWGVLLVAVLVQFGAHFIKTISPLKAYYAKDPKWSPPIDSLRWGWFQSIGTLPNLILPAIGGVIVDKRWGVKLGVMFFLGVVCIGQFIFFLGTRIHTYWLAMTGRFIAGVGQGCVSSLTGAIAAIYFPNKITFAIGLTESFHSLSGVVSKTTLAPVAELFHGDYSMSILWGLFWCLVSSVVSYWWLKMSKKTRYRQMPQQHVRVKGAAIFRDFRRTLMLPLAFWVVCILHLLFSNAHRVFGHIDADYLRAKYNYSKVESGQSAAITDSLGIILSPLMGLAIDYTGRSAVSLPVILMVAGLIGSLGYYLLSSDLLASPDVPLFMLSFCNAITPTVLRATVPSAIQGSGALFATAYGCYEVMEAAGVFIGGWMVGLVKTMTGTYQEVVLWFAFSLILAVLLSLTLLVMQSRRGKAAAETGSTTSDEEEGNSILTDRVTMPKKDQPSAIGGHAA
ncbi:hypothetical protein FOZ63_027439 [Perkinsus olseni]|uniref:Lysosomal dipeptide transporter MFSD1 n=2 Tax=Perkinsus olseni TaxID=32597 RepID=A0A7J6PP08_PEROL|nr:hypothetical protein FOZ63_027439 [Perkinsus olseni]